MWEVEVHLVLPIPVPVWHVHVPVHVPAQEAALPAAPRNWIITMLDYTG